MPESDVEDEYPIALSELVRTGETSRQRRRGLVPSSMSVDHSIRRTVAGADMPWIRPPLGPVIVPPAPQAPEGSMTESAEWTDFVMQDVRIRQPSMSMSNYSTWALEDPPKVDDARDEGGATYRLYCGFEEWCFDEAEPFEVSPLPDYPGVSYTRAKRSPSRRFKKSNGCGALIHISGTPRTRFGTWQAKGRATSVVVPLDKAFFNIGGTMQASPCGCRNYGVACSVCGNTLGNLYIPCPSVPPAQTRHDGVPIVAHIYTFFSTATTSSPAFTFPNPPSTEPLRISPPSSTIGLRPLSFSSSAPPSPTELDPTITTMMEIGLRIGEDTDYLNDGDSFGSWEPDVIGDMFDPDGVLVSSMDGNGIFVGLGGDELGHGDESSSPKIDGRMLWPER